MKPAPRCRSLGLALSVLVCLFSHSAYAFKPIGHEAIEALAYTTLAREPVQPMCYDEAGKADPESSVTGLEVLRLLMATGALAAPTCFDTAPDSYESGSCGRTDARGSLPPLGAGNPDDLFARQLGPDGQCFHFMAEVNDAWNHGLTNTAYRRCTRVLNELWLETIANPARSRNADRGLYALIHAIEDSLSEAHTERDEEGNIRALRPWDLLSLPYLVHWSALPDWFSGRQHEISDERDDGWRTDEVSERCPANADPYTLAQTPACFSMRGQVGAYAVEDLLKVTYCAFRAGTLPKAWSSTNPPSGAVSPGVERQWNAFLNNYVPSAFGERPTALNATRRIRPERVPQLLAGLRGRSGPDRAGKPGDVVLALETFPPLRDVYPLVPLWGLELGLRWKGGERQAGGSVTLLSAMLPLSQSFGIGFQPITLEGFWPIDAAKTGQLDVLSSLRLSFVFGRFWLDLASPRFAWRAGGFRHDPAITIGHAWDLTEVGSLGESGYRNAGASWEMRDFHPPPSSWWDPRTRQSLVVSGSMGMQAGPRANGYGLRLVLPEVLYSPLSAAWMDVGGAFTATTIRDTGHVTSVAFAPRLRFYPGSWRVLGLGLTPLEFETGAASESSGTYWGITSVAHAFLRLGALEVAADVPFQHWRGNRNYELGTPAFVRFGWVQRL